MFFSALLHHIALLLALTTVSLAESGLGSTVRDGPIPKDEPSNAECDVTKGGICSAELSKREISSAEDTGVEPDKDATNATGIFVPLLEGSGTRRFTI